MIFEKSLWCLIVRKCQKMFQLTKFFKHSSDITLSYLTLKKYHCNKSKFMNNFRHYAYMVILLIKIDNVA